MVSRYLLISVLLIFTFSFSYGQFQTTDQKLRDEVRRYGQANVSIPYPGRQLVNQISEKISITSVRDGKVYISLSGLTAEWFIAQKFSYNILPRPETKGLKTAANLAEAMDWQTYPSYNQYLAIMKSFVQTYPSLCRLDTIGTSVNGKLVLALKISDNVLASENEPQVFYSSTIHGDELGGFVLMMRLADYLLKNYTLDNKVANLVNNLEIWINPLANPDGAYHGDTTVINAIRYNANGFDLNRNFPDPATPYSVSNPEQKETIDMVKFLREHNFVISANFHAGEEVVNYPWDYPDNKKSATHADNDWFVLVSRAYADTAHAHSVPGYMTFANNGITLGYLWYSINGGRQDFITWYLHGREVTIELDYAGMTSSDRLDSLWKYNGRSFLRYIGNALYGIHGLVKDAVSASPVSARIFISGHDIDSSQVYSDSLTGSFTRLLMPGIWNLTFSAKGYIDTTINNLVVQDTIPLDLVVMMEPVFTPPDTTYPYLPFLWPNPSSSVINCTLPETLYGNIRVTVFDQLGKKTIEFNENYLPGGKLIINAGELPAGSYYVVFRNLATGYHITSRIVVTGRFN